MPRRSSAAVLAVLALAAACSSGPNVVPRPTGQTELVMAVVVAHSSDTAQQRLLDLPVAAIFGDGRLIHPGAQAESNPGPALPALAVTPLDGAGVDALLSAAKDAGLLGADQEMRFPVEPDPAITIFVIVAAGDRHQTVIEALQEVQAGDPRLSPDNLKQREAMKAVLALMVDPRQLLAAHVTGDDSAYEPTALRIMVAPASANPEPSPLPPAVREWPLAGGLAALGQALGGQPNVRCGTVEGDDFATLYPLVRQSNELTLWSSGGVSYALRFRPLLPGESGCG
jgi:hypothetical protein